MVRPNNLAKTFHSPNYLRHNARRLEHLASLRIPVAGMSVLEVGAGIGDHSHYYIDRGCSITITEARTENLQYLKKRYPKNNVQFLDMDNPSAVEGSPFDIVHCYGLLYHLKDPEQALEFLCRSTRKNLFLETCVSFGQEDKLNPVAESRSEPSQSYSGIGCRPTRLWLFQRLQRFVENVYLPKTQPNHEEFPLDWTEPEKHKARFQRAIFIASREVLKNDMLTRSLLNKQRRHN
ncbi:MAG: class I SAM-dependent methyltransferase [Symploca sp. SIO1C2]|nr:class I SAM-dependent methyltransferase [Symploca sp. SIO1C2]